MRAFSPRYGENPSMPEPRASGAVVVSDFSGTAALQQLTGLIADGTWVLIASKLKIQDHRSRRHHVTPLDD